MGEGRSGVGGKPKAKTMGGWVQNRSARWKGMQGGEGRGGFVAGAVLCSVRVCVCLRMQGLEGRRR